MSLSQKFKDELEFNSNITFLEAVQRFPTLSRSNFDKLKSEYRKEQRQKLNLPTGTNKKKSKNKKGSKTSPGKKNLITAAQLKSMSIKGKLKLFGETALDNYLLTGAETRAFGKAIDILMKPEFIEQGEIVHGVYWTSDTPPYRRPEFMYEHQKVAMKLMDIGHLLWQASRQLAGKTTTGLLKDFEDLLFNDNYSVALIAPTVPLARELLFKWLYTAINYKGKQFCFYDIIRPYLKKDPNADGYILKNSSRLMIVSLKYAGSQGRTLNVAHIEELDKLGKEQSKREALAGVIGSIRVNPAARIRIFCNNLSGIFRLLKAELYKYGHYFNIYLEDPFAVDDKYSGVHTIINEDVVVKEVPKLDEFLTIFYEILVSSSFALGQLYNIDAVNDECFNPEKVENAYNNPRANDPPLYVRTTMGIDPAGAQDAFGVSIWSKRLSGDVEFRWGKRFYNATHEVKVLARIVAANAILFGVEEIQAESSVGSAWVVSLIKDEINKQSKGKLKCKIIYINFQGKGKTYDKNNFVFLFRILLDNGNIILHQRDKEEKELHRQITLYIPNKGLSENNPDDLIESGFHGIWSLLKGWKYLKEITEKVIKPVVVTTNE